jgi:hypothetical protein
MELLDKFAETVDKSHTSFITKSKIKVLMETDYSNKKWASQSGKQTKYYLIEMRTDVKRLKELRYRWGDNEKSFIPESEKHYGSRTYDGEETYRYGRTHDSPGLLTLKSRAWENFTVDRHLASRDPVSGCFGYLRGDYERFDRILKKAGPGRVTVRDKMEDLNGTAHYVIDAKTERGQYTIWLNPEKGYNFSKATVSREEGDFFMKDYKFEAGCKYIISVDNTQFTEVDGVWVPVKGKVKLHSTTPTTDLNTIAELELTSILIDPDHDALDSFSVDDIKDGAKVLYGDKRPGEYVWQDGKVVADVDKDAIDELDRMAEEIMAEAKDNSDTNAPSNIMPEKKTEIADLTVSELLNKYRATQSKLQSFVAKAETKIEKNSPSGVVEKRHCEFRTDGERVYHRSFLPPDETDYKSFLWDGKSFIEYIGAKEVKNSRVSIRESGLGKNEKIATEYKGAALLGFLAGDSERVDAVLGRADTISVKDKPEEVGQADCYVIEAAVKQDKYKIWMAFEHGYNIAKAEVQKTDGPEKLSFTLENVRFEKIDGVWAPMEADMRHSMARKGQTVKWRHRRTEMILNPEHDTLGSFVGEIPDGTKVIYPGRFDEIKYVWQDGKPVAEAESNVKP